MKCKTEDLGMARKKSTAARAGKGSTREPRQYRDF